MGALTPKVILFKSLGGVLEALPERLDGWLATGIARNVGRAALTSRSHLRNNLLRALNAPTGSLSEELLERFCDRAYESYGQYWAEGAKLPALTTESVTSRFRVSEGLEYLRGAKDLGRGVIVALPHVGSWEWGARYLGHIGLPVTAVAEALEPPELFEWFQEKRHAMGLTIKPLDASAGTAIMGTLKAGGVVALLCDRDIQNNGIEVEFFGEIVTMPAGPATIALRTGAALLTAACYAGPGRGHHAVMNKPLEVERTGRLRDDVHRITQEIARQLEWLIQRAPEQWHVLQPRFAEKM